MNSTTTKNGGNTSSFPAHSSLISDHDGGGTAEASVTPSLCSLLIQGCRHMPAPTETSRPQLFADPFQASFPMEEDERMITSTTTAGQGATRGYLLDVLEDALEIVDNQQEEESTATTRMTNCPNPVDTSFSRPLFARQ